MVNGEEGRETLVAAIRLRDSVRASLCRAALEQAGIDAWLPTENLAGIAPHLGIAIGIDVLVRTSDVAAARELIEQFEAGVLAVPEESDSCPHCGTLGAMHLHALLPGLVVWWLGRGVQAEPSR
jgi:hypothetical protein